jgi:hypothetical protein
MAPTGMGRGRMDRQAARIADVGDVIKKQRVDQFAVNFRAVGQFEPDRRRCLTLYSDTSGHHPEDAALFEIPEDCDCFPDRRATLPMTDQYGRPARRATSLDPLCCVELVANMLGQSMTLIADVGNGHDFPKCSPGQRSNREDPGRWVPRCID